MPRGEREEREGRPQALATRGERVGADRGDEPRVGADDLGEPLLDLDEVAIQAGRATDECEGPAHCGQRNRPGRPGGAARPVSGPVSVGGQTEDGADGEPRIELDARQSQQTAQDAGLGVSRSISVPDCRQDLNERRKAVPSSPKTGPRRSLRPTTG